MLHNVYTYMLVFRLLAHFVILLTIVTFIRWKIFKSNNILLIYRDENGQLEIYQKMKTSASMVKISRSWVKYGLSIFLACFQTLKKQTEKLGSVEYSHLCIQMPFFK